jgi:hypothetical protein
VSFMGGTDTAPGVYVMPGFSFHDELANLVEAGFMRIRNVRLSSLTLVRTISGAPFRFLRTTSAFTNTRTIPRMSVSSRAFASECRPAPAHHA